MSRGFNASMRAKNGNMSFSANISRGADNIYHRRRRRRVSRPPRTTPRGPGFHMLVDVTLLIRPLEENRFFQKTGHTSKSLFLVALQVTTPCLIDDY